MKDNISYTSAYGRAATMVLALFFSFRLIAQDHKPYSITYAAGSTGINNSVGIFGLSCERIFNANTRNNMSLTGGAGMSTWGAKLSVEGRHYFGSYHRGWAIAMGFTLSTGYRDDHENMEVYYAAGSTIIRGFEDVTVTRLPQLNFFPTLSHYWRVGRKENRLCTSLGWSIPFTSNKIKQTSGNPIRPSQENAGFIMLYAPRGPVLSIGYSLALAKKENGS